MILGSVWKTIYPPILCLTPNLWPSQWENDDWPSTFRGAQVSDKPIIQNGLMGCPKFPRWQMALALAKRTVGRLGRWVGHTFDLCDSFAVHNTEQQGSRAAAGQQGSGSSIWRTYNSLLLEYSVDHSFLWVFQYIAIVCHRTRHSRFQAACDIVLTWSPFLRFTVKHLLPS